MLIKKGDKCICGNELSELGKNLICKNCGKTYLQINETEFYENKGKENIEYMLIG